VSDERSGSASDVTQREFVGGQRLLGRYTLIKILGRGGMGIVWLAHDEELERDVALKFLPDLIINDAAVLTDLKRETKRCLELTHKNIVRIYDFVHDERSGCISMEYIDGDTLSKLRCDKERKVFEAAELTDWMSQLCDALDYAHNYAHIIHRDLKPANLMVNQRGALKVSDFGIARSLGDSMSVITKAGGRSGTLAYMSPQQLEGERGTHLDDIYSLGASVYELLTSKPPFYVGNIDRQIRKKIPPSMTERRKEFNIEPALVSPVWEEVVAACLAKDPARRPQSTTEIAQRLQLASLQIKPVTTVSAAGPKRKMFLGAGVAALLLCALAGWYFGLLEPHRKPAAAISTPPQTTAPTPPAIQEKSIAVLPFENRSEDKGNAYFAAGIQDEILTRLANLRELKVISRTSTEKYPSRPQNLKAIGAELGVAAVLEGSVQKLANEAHINVQLINARTDEHIWAQSYDRTLEHVFAVEGEVAQSVANALKVKLLPARIEKLNALPTQTPEAYDLFLKGEYARQRAWMSGGYEQALKPAITYFPEAVALDPQFALAFAQLAETQLTEYHFGVIDDSAKRMPELLASAKDNIDRALHLEPDLAAAHVALGHWHYWGKSDYAAGLAEFERALTLDPHFSEASIGITGIALRQGRPDEVIAYVSKAIEFDPRNPRLLRSLAMGYRMQKDYARAVESSSRAVALDPTSEIDAINLSQTIIKGKGDILAASNVLESVPTELQKNAAMAEHRVWLLMLSQDFTAAEKIVENLPAESWRSDWRRPLLLGEIRRALGQKEGARESFQQARTLLTAAIAKEDSEPLMHADLALVDAGLGLAAEALREAGRAIDLQPVEKDALWGAQWLENLAEVNAQLGRTNEAIKLLERLLAMPNDSISVWQLKLEPSWDPIRNDPRFQKLASSAPKEAQ
jgi:serine/threonine protein kinase/tetratricopeptide (TPR) repeat protein